MAILQHLIRSPFVRSWSGPLALAALLLASCRSTGSGGERPMLVTLRDYQNGARFELASESHSDPVEYYSDKREDAVRKIQTDEIMSAFLGELDRSGLGTHGRTGHAPELGKSDVVSWGIEVETPAQSVHWMVGKGSALEEWKQFQRCRDVFLQLYNVTVSYQTVQNESGKQFFEGKRATIQTRP